MSEADDVAKAFADDERAALNREIGELRERLAVQGAKECASCGAVFRLGEGHVHMAKKEEKGEGDELAKLKAEKAALQRELAAAKGGASKPAAKPAADDDDEEADDDETGFGFF